MLVCYVFHESFRTNSMLLIQAPGNNLLCGPMSIKSLSIYGVARPLPVMVNYSFCFETDFLMYTARPKRYIRGLHFFCLLVRHQSILPMLRHWYRCNQTILQDVNESMIWIQYFSWHIHFDKYINGNDCLVWYLLPGLQWQNTVLHKKYQSASCLVVFCSGSVGFTLFLQETG